MYIQSLKDLLHERVLVYRAIDLLINSSDFELVYNSATDAEKMTLFNFVKTGNKLALKGEVRRILDRLTPFESMSLTRLRVIAKHLHINYTELTKITLIEEINKVIKCVKESSLRVGIIKYKIEQSKETGEIVKGEIVKGENNVVIQRTENYTS